MDNDNDSNDDDEDNNTDNRKCMVTEVKMSRKDLYVVVVLV